MIRIHDLRVADVMSGTLLCLEAATDVKAGYAKLVGSGVSGAPVIGADAKMLGTVSAHDLLACSVASDEGSKTVGDALAGEPVTCLKEASLAEASGLMVRNRMHRVVVVSEDGVPIGMLSAIDVVRAVACVSELAQESAERFASRLASLVGGEIV